MGTHELHPPVTAPRVRAPNARALAVVAILGLAAGAALATLGLGGASVAASADILTIDEDGWRYSYQVLTGDETLHALANDPRQAQNLASSRPDIVQRLRHRLERETHVTDLSDLRAAQSATIQKLRALGYL